MYIVPHYLTHKLDLRTGLDGMYPKSEKILHNAVTKIVLPAPDDVHSIINDL